MRTLVTDDDPICRTVLQRSLQPFGPVACAENGVEAVPEFARALAAGTPFDLVTLDLMMPEFDGQQTLKVLRRLETLFPGARPCTVAITSALEDKDNVFTAFKEQADLYFVKPLVLAEIQADLRGIGLITG